MAIRSPSPVSASRPVIDENENENAVEDTPLLGNDHDIQRTRRRSSVVGNAEHGYLAIPIVLPEEPVVQPKGNVRSVFSILSVLLIGVFISQLDGTLLLATIGTISSEFDDLHSAQWLFSSYGLASCVAQPLYGKLSDIFGRKKMLQVAYFLFALGGLLCGLGRTMSKVIVGRVVQGAGGAGMVVLVSILITDLVPLREVAAYRSYVNIVQTVGRSCGGPIGGALAQTIGWRWAFMLQAPLTVIAMVLVWWKLDLKPKTKDHGSEETQSKASTFKRIDFVGAIFMSGTILSAMLVLDMGGSKVPWKSPTVAGLVIAAITSGVLFFVTEKYWAAEPIFPLKLLVHKHVVLDYAFLLIQIASQMALMLYIPLYFHVTKNSSPAEGGAYMVPSVMGNTVGGLLTGHYVKRTGQYKKPLILSSLSAILCFTLLLVTWRGDTPFWQAIFVFFGGFGTGIANSAVFVDLAASVDENEIAIASSGLYLSSNIGAVTGVSTASVIFESALVSKLVKNLANIPHGHNIAKKAASNIEYVQHLHGKIRQLVVEAYVYGFHHSFVFSLCCGVVTLLLGLILTEKKLHH